MERGALAERLGVRRRSTAAESVVVDETDPVRFMAAFSVAAASQGNVFLANPAWGPGERSVLGEMAARGERGERGWLMIPSGGSSGAVKFARHDGGSLAAAVRGFSRHFGIERVNCVCVLPLHHVSGLMAWMRSALTGGTFVPWSWKELEKGRFPAELPVDACLSLVPTQLTRLLSVPTAPDWLRRFKVISIGGGPARDSLLDDAARLGLPLSTGFGATETAAMAAAVRPSQFLSGMRGCGEALPHASIDLVDGVVRVSGESVFRGYFPSADDTGTWLSGDLGRIGPDGSLQILGRNDDVVVTGGKKVSASEVEAALAASGLFEDVAVIGIPDAEWGEAVVACHPRGARPADSAQLKKSLSGLAAFKRPKRFIEISPWPRSGHGKIDRAELRRLALAAAP